MMGGPPGLVFAEMMKSFHEAAYELPEDYFERVESGLDADARSRLEAGFRSGQRVTRIRSWGWAAVVLGLFLLIGSFATAAFFPDAFLVVLAAALLALAAGILLYAYAVFVYAAHRKEIHGFVAFVHASRTSSLGRDLA